jgi:hypothetical protein
MVDASLLPAIKAAIRANELGDASPYRISFACLGQSGASFGIFQGDTNVNHNARATLDRVLMNAATPQPVCNRIMAAISRPCPRNPLSEADTATVNNALSSAAGIAMVDAMDNSLLQIVLTELDGAIAAAAVRGMKIDPQALLYIALWVNMTGAPITLNQWLRGAPELGAAIPIGPTVTRQNLENYLQVSKYFQLHPSNLVHMTDSVNQGVAALPAA